MKPQFTQEQIRAEITNLAKTLKNMGCEYIIAVKNGEELEVMIGGKRSTLHGLVCAAGAAVFGDVRGKVRE